MSINQAGRITLLLLSLGLAIMAVKDTPEPDNVENKGLYRMLYGYACLRGLAFLWFDALNLFPLE